MFRFTRDLLLVCTTLAVRLMSGEGCVNFDRHVCLLFTDHPPNILGSSVL